MQAVPEDKAVDLYVMERAFLSTHPDSDLIVRFASELNVRILLYFPDFSSFVTSGGSNTRRISTK